MGNAKQLTICDIMKSLLQMHKKPAFSLVDESVLKCQVRVIVNLK